MNVLHCIPRITGTSIPVEIAAATQEFTDVEVSIVAEESVDDQVPDTIHPEQILTDWCGFDDYRVLLAGISEEFDIIHTHHIGPAAKIGVQSSPDQIRHVNTQHGHVHYTSKEKIKNIPGLVFADRIIYNSRATAGSYNFFERACKLRTKEDVVYNGVRTSVTDRFRSEIADEPTKIVTAARLVPRKNIQVLIRSLKHAPEFKLRVVGGGPQRDNLETVARQSGVNSRVEFVGYLHDRKDVYDEFSEADVFVLPSAGEGFCVAVAEAMAIGLPVIISDLQVFHEVVGECGVFVDRTSPRDVAESLRNLQQHPNLARNRGEQSRKRIKREFNLRQCAQNHQEVYEDCMK